MNNNVLESFNDFLPWLRDIIKDDFDSYAMWLGFEAQLRSKCLSRSIGCVIMRDKYIVATGYNGPTSGFPHPAICKRKEMNVPSGQRLELCNCAHAEANAISQAACNGHSTFGTTLYTPTVIPCTLICTPMIIAAGIKKVMCLKKEEYLSDPEATTSSAKFDYAGVEVAEYNGQLREFLLAINAGMRITCHKPNN